MRTTSLTHTKTSKVQGNVPTQENAAKGLAIFFHSGESREGGYTSLQV